MPICAGIDMRKDQKRRGAGTRSHILFPRHDTSPHFGEMLLFDACLINFLWFIVIGYLTMR